ncbi:MAG: hypothetical protein L6R35_000796 [Caloplaca aegaea]|nr:MAG: hypothetical protein L6R35_000796 [Caloplaca aegaea]
MAVTPSTTPASERSITTKRSSTLFPKIGKISDFLYNLKQVAPQASAVRIVGTVKLHGAHADWVVVNDDTIRVQSRNVLDLSSTRDNYGLFAFTSSLHIAIRRLRDKISSRYQQLNPGLTIDSAFPVIISGEWCGKGIQKGMALSKLEKHFVIISIRVNDEWVDDTEYADIHDEANGIYNVSKAGRYRLDYDLDAPETSDVTIQNWVSDIEHLCPYGASRGVQGRGEGIVWKAANDIDNPALWFKSKAMSHTISNSSKLPNAAVAPGNRQRAENFAMAVVTGPRLEQGWEFLKETGVIRDLAATSKFVAWITNDILVEEEKEMSQKDIPKCKLKPAIKAIAEVWYKENLTKAAEEDDAEYEAMAEKMKSLET